MAYSKIEITFNNVPTPGDRLYIIESSLGLNLHERFQTTRYAAGTVSIPPYSPPDGVNPGRYHGYSAINYQTAFNADFNSTSLFTVIATSGTTHLGLGTVTIIANYPDAVFALDDVIDVDATVVITNEGASPPEEGDISYTPISLFFEHTQNEPFVSQGIAFDGDLWKIVGKPNFLLSSATPGVTVTSTGSGETLFQTISGSGTAIVNIALTEYYDGDIDFTGDDIAGTFDVFNDDVLDGTISYTVAVTKLSDFLTIPYAPGEKAFTLDTKFLELFSDNIDSYFQLVATVKTYDFFTDEEYVNDISQKFVLFKGKAKLNLGLIIHRLMKNFEAVNENELQYKFATLTINCSENLVANDEEIRKGVSAEIPFVAGLSRGMTDYGFLQMNVKPVRVTKSSIAYLNFIVPSEDYELRIFKNGDYLTTRYLDIDPDKVMCYSLTFGNYNQGDVIAFYLDKAVDEPGTGTSKRFIVFPEGKYSNHLIWENEFLLQSRLECTGVASIKSDIEFKTQKLYQNLVEVTKILDTTKEVKLTINTGWLLKNDIDDIESLMRSKRVWFLGYNEINLIPTTKTIINDDTERELIEFSLEFLINRNYDAETYSL